MIVPYKEHNNQSQVAIRTKYILSSEIKSLDDRHVLHKKTKYSLFLEFYRKPQYNDNLYSFITMSLEVSLYMLSDSTGETLISFSKGLVSSFPSVKVQKQLFSMIRSEKQMLDIIENITGRVFVLHTINNSIIQNSLKQECIKEQIPCISILADATEKLSYYLGIPPTHSSSNKKLKKEYFSRIDAMNYTIAHDDGQSAHDIHEADIILVGVSRTSKTPSSIYLSYRGYKIANIPFISGISFPKQLDDLLTSKLIVALTIDPKYLVDIRKNRMASLGTDININYVNYNAILLEIIEAQKVFKQRNWPTIDVTMKSVEEISNTIIEYYNKHNC